MSHRPASALDPFANQTELFHAASPAPNGRPTGENGSRKPKSRPAGFDGLKAPSTCGKNFVIDTNVLLHDPECIRRFADNHVCIPVEVLCELDRFKAEQSERGANARTVHRELAELFSAHPELATRGIPTPDGGTVRLVNCDPADRRAARAVAHLREMLPTLDTPDHRLLLCTRVIGEINPAPAALVTKDLNLQLKAHALGIPCEDYLSDKVQNDSAITRKVRTLEIEPTEMQRFASTGELALAARHLPDLAPNEYVLFQAGDSKRTMPARHVAGAAFVRLRLPESIRIQKGATIRPLNLGQQCFLDALLNPDITLVTCYGQAGTGKTLLAVASALHATFSGGYAGVTVSRPVVPLGDTLGFLPGSLDEKLHPWLKPIFDALEFLTTPPDPADRARKPRRPVSGQKQPAPGGPPQKPYQPFLDSGLIEVEALCYIRGRSIPNRFFILDEAQQLTPLEAKTIVTRMARGSKLVLVGDPAQIDNPYVDRRSNGLVYTRERLENQTFTAHVTLERGERSDLAEAGARLM
ncbi:MAG: PhoH family protein [Verrucomicrobiales bacterium]|nr:PhoH family protein [Verrucomicrobiales bacterium]